MTEEEINEVLRSVSKPVERNFEITFHTKEGWDQFHKALQEYAELHFGKFEDCEHKEKRSKKEKSGGFN